MEKITQTAKFSFVEHLKSRLETDQGLSKGELTRLRLIKAAAELFNETQYHELRMLDIATKAEVSNGAVYSYFKDKRDITIVVFTEFIRFNQSSLLKFPMPTKPRRVLPEIYTYYVRMYAHNVGLMAALRHLSVEMPEIGKMIEDGYTSWCTQLARFLKSTGKASPFLNEGHEAWTIRALSVMAAEFLFDLYVRKSEMLADLRDRPEVTGELLASMWMRICLKLDPVEMAEERSEGLTPGDVIPSLASSIQNDSDSEVGIVQARLKEREVIH